VDQNFAMKCKHKLIKDSQGKTHPAYLSCFRKSKSNVNSQQKLKNKRFLKNSNEAAHWILGS
jgi:hypothetical protein